MIMITLRRALLGLYLLVFAIPVAAQVIDTQNITAQDAGNCATANACANFPLNSNPTVTLQISGTFSATLAFETTSDGITWVTTLFTNIGDGNQVASTTAAGQFALGNTGVLRMRVRATTYASGVIRVVATGGRLSGSGLGGGGGGGGGGAPTTAQYWVGAADGTLSAEKNLGALSTALVINTAGVPSAYAGTTCTNQFPRTLSAVGAATCASVALGADVSGDLPFANLTQIAGLSVLGVTGNVTADVAAITAANDGEVLRRSGTAVAFGTVGTAGIADNAITLAKFATQSNLTILANVSGGAAVPTASTFSAIADATVSSTQGSIMYRNATTWVALTPGTNGQFLKTQGAAANPIWATAAGGGNVSAFGTPTATHVAIWHSATEIEDGGVMPTFVDPNADKMLAFKDSDTTIQAVTLTSDFGFSSFTLSMANFTPPSGGAIRTSTSAANTVLFQAYDTDLTGYVTFATLTANNTPTFDLAAATTHNGQIILDATNTVTKTGLTLDCINGAGNNCTTSSYIYYPMGVCQGSTAGSGLSLPVTGPAVAACLTGSNTQQGTLDFAAASDLSVQGSFVLPLDWSGTINVYGKWMNTAGSGNVVWELQTACVASGESTDPSFTAAAGSATDAALGSSFENDFTMTAVTMTGCAAGETFYWKVRRNAGAGSDTFNNTARLLRLQFLVLRTQ
jgi:hypothetical protein